MKIVIDASTAVSLVLNHDFSESIADAVLDAEKVIAPTLFCAEVGNSLRRYHRLGKLEFRDSIARYWEALEYVDEFIDIQGLTQAALRRACSLDHSIYDMYYLVLAEQYNAHLMSLDKRLVQLAEEQGINYMQFLKLNELGL
jgi:predicted nucleic acid-binding protein